MFLTEHFVSRAKTQNLIIYDNEILSNYLAHKLSFWTGGEAIGNL